MRRILTVLFICLLAQANSQVTASDCSVAVTICTNNSFSVQPSGSGSVIDFSTSSNISNPTPGSSAILPPGGSGCLYSGELNPTWMIIAVQSSGTLEFSLGAGTGPGAQSGCYDWIMWPYTGSVCSSINANSLAPVRCCWNNHCSGGTGLASSANLPAGSFADDFGAPLNVNCGQKYIICFSNYSSVTTLVPLNFFGSAVVSCTATASVPVISVSGNTMICQGQNTTLTASGVSSYTWSTGVNTNSAVVTPSTSSSYTVSGDNGTCVGQSVVTVSVSACTGIQSIQNSPVVNVYPNPSSGTFTVKMNDVSDNISLELINAMGQKVLIRSLNTGENEVKTAGLSESIYYYSVKQESRIIAFGKLMIE